MSVVLSAAVAAAALPRASEAQTPAENGETDPSVQRDIQQLLATLNDPSAPQEDRNEAARRLLQRQNEEIRQALRAVLVDVGNRGGQLAVALALANTPTPLEMYKDPLFALLGADSKLTEAGAQALANFKGNPEVLTRLATNYALARQQRETVRIAAIKALGALVEKRAAEILVNLASSDDESATIRAAAADALIQMTGIRENARDTQRWQQWWNENGAKSDADFKNDLLYSRAARFDQLQLRYTQFRNEVQAQLESQYQAVPEAQKSEMVLRFLKSPEPEIRSVGARLIYDDAINARPIPEAAKQRLREMIGDSSSDVRLDVADSLRAINDADALEPLLAQLAQESNPDVRARLAAAIAPIRDLRAVPELLKLLKDSSYRAAEAAANALRVMAPVIVEKDPAMSKEVAKALVETIDTTAGRSAATGLRESAVEALGPLRDPAMINVFTRLLGPNESPRIRRAALRGLAELRDPNTADTIANSLDDRSDSSVRMQAVIALGATATFAHAEKLWRLMDPAVESDPAVREQAWRVLQNLFASTPKEQLAQWADRFRDQPARRLSVQLALRDVLEKEKDEVQLAVVRQNIGETYMKLNQPAEATPYFKAALDYYRASRARDMVVEGLVGQYLDSLLGSRKYAEACKFAAESIAENPSDQQTMGSRIRTKVERLRDEGAADDALLLIGEALKMSPPLAARYVNDLESIREDLQKRG